MPEVVVEWLMQALMAVDVWPPDALESYQVRRMWAESVARAYVSREAAQRRTANRTADEQGPMGIDQEKR